MDKIIFNKFIRAISRFYAEKRILVGSEIYDLMAEIDKQEKSGFTLIKCDAIKDKVVVFGRGFPLNNRDVTIEEILALDDVVSKIKPTYFAMPEKNDPEKYINLFSDNGNKLDVLQIEGSNAILVK
jgi:hypothetical protein